MWSLWWAGCATTAPPVEPAPVSDHFEHSFRGAEHWAAVFDDPDRDTWQRPDDVIAALSPRPDARIADLGAGTGYFSVRLARAAPQGTVYAVDVEPDMIRYLESRAAKEGVTNLVPVLAGPDDPHLPEPVDLVLVVDTYHHIASRTAYFRRLHDQLRPGGRLVVIDFTKESPEGPPVEHRLAPERVAEELTAAGFRQLENPLTLPRQYLLVFAP